VPVPLVEVVARRYRGIAGAQAGRQVRIALEADAARRLAQRDQREHPAGDLEDRHPVTERVILRRPRLGPARLDYPVTLRSGRHHGPASSCRHLRLAARLAWLPGMDNYRPWSPYHRDTWIAHHGNSGRRAGDSGTGHKSQRRSTKVRGGLALLALVEGGLTSSTLLVRRAPAALVAARASWEGIVFLFRPRLLAAAIALGVTGAFGAVPAIAATPPPPGSEGPAGPPALLPNGRVASPPQVTAPVISTGCPAAPYGARSGAPGSGKTVALTFDDGPGPSTAGIMSTLASYRVPATFFNLGQNMAVRPALVRQEASAGYMLGNHTWDHPNMTKLT